MSDLGKLIPLRPGQDTRLAGPALEAVPYDRDTLLEDREADQLSVADQSAAPVPVDQPTGATAWEPPWHGEQQWQPVVAPWLASRDERRAASRWALRRLRHQAAFHLGRSPVYAARALSPVSIGRSLGRAARWASDPETTARVAGAPRGETKEYLQLREQLAAARRNRTALLGTGAIGFGGAEAAVALAGPGYGPWLLALAAAGLLGVAGRRQDKPLLDVAVVAESKAPKLTSDAVIRALAGLGIGALAKPDAVKFVGPIARDFAGWRADIDLPESVTAAEVVKERETLAANLRRPLGCVWPDTAPRIHPGRLVLWVGDEAMSDARPDPWPLLDRGKVNLFEPVPFGTDQRGRPVLLTLMYVAAVIGAVPRMGKTFAARLLLLAAALDARAELHAYDLKGTGDFDALEQVAHRFRAGDDREDIEYAIADLRSLRTEMRRRTKVIRSLPKSVCPESKVTDELASVRSHGLHPVLVVADECQRWFEDKEYGAEFEEICGDLVRRGPATGIITVFSTQRPDAKSIPPIISANAVTRFCLKVTGHVANDMVLGTGMWKAGVQAATFAFEDKGIGYLAGEGTMPRIVRSAYVDGEQADRVAARARALRVAAGTLTGHAIGETFDADAGPDFSLLADLMTVMGEEKVHSDVLCERLGEQWPDRYAGWQPPTLAAALKPLGVSTQRQVWAERPDGTATNRAGVRREDLQSAVDARL